jgi:hypothetical protein
MLKLLFKLFEKIKEINDIEIDKPGFESLWPTTTPVKPGFKILSKLVKFTKKLGKFTKKSVSKFTNKFDGNALKPLEQEKIRITAPLGFIQNHKIQILVGVTITLLGLGISGFIRFRKNRPPAQEIEKKKLDILEFVFQPSKLSTLSHSQRQIRIPSTLKSGNEESSLPNERKVREAHQFRYPLRSF